MAQLQFTAAPVAHRRAWLWPRPLTSYGSSRDTALRGDTRAAVVCRGVSHAIIEELADSPGSPFHSLGLERHREAGGYARAARRQVALLRRLQADPGALALASPPDWAALFARPSLPLVLDLGCGAGRCMLAAAAAAGAAAGAAEVEGGMEGAGAAARVAVAAGGVAAAEDSGVLRGRGRGRAADAASDPARGPSGRTAASGAGAAVGASGGGGGCSIPGGTATGGAGAAAAAAAAASAAAAGGPVSGGANFLGLDVRLALTQRANAWASLLGLGGRAAFLCANANASLPHLLGLGLGPQGGRRPAGAGAGAGAGGAEEEAAAAAEPSFRQEQEQGGRAGHQAAAASRGTRPPTPQPQHTPHPPQPPVALVCIQFPDPPVRSGDGLKRPELLGCGREAEALAAGLRPGALVWIQSDVRSIALDHRRRFASLPGAPFAPSARHAAAASRTRTRHWLPPPGGQPPTANGGPTAAMEPAAARAAAAAEPSVGRVEGSGAGAAAAAAEAAADEALIAAAAAAGAAVPPLVLVDLAAYREPWLRPEEVAAVVRQHARRAAALSRTAVAQTVSVAAARAAAEGAAGAEDGSDIDEEGEEQGGNDEEGEDGGEDGGDPWAGLPWLDGNPLGSPTEREVYVERGGRGVYRLLLVRV
ncbi:hypothetical protein HYH03_013553 [Edaphochlamys debaryana]|uniref:Uncharacterized protein n=1 Tax=Edaphochlamys debaryana TaxID=47281 RepID=A0A835XTA9_9CHLO|nr:hypothetical protein HYH03_013553 [Edaphochlamys debaryana]|eukprot:KAG2487836.1 hypothetical protein HYH03_013553 [Edaphochlamys debaryana]